MEIDIPTFDAHPPYLYTLYVTTTMCMGHGSIEWHYHK